MFDADIRINGNMVCHIYGHNEGTVLVDNKVELGIYSYYYEVYYVGDKVKSGYVHHNRADGIEKLIETILRKANETKTRKRDRPDKGKTVS